MVVNAESNILPYIETDVNGNTLRIYIRGLHNVKNHFLWKFILQHQILKKLHKVDRELLQPDYFTSEEYVDVIISGSGSIETAIDAVTIDAVVSGSGNFNSFRSANVADFTVSGSGKIDAYDFAVRDCEAMISGSGNVWINVDHYLKATISGSGNVYCTGDAEIETHISGSGKVFHEN